jgi:hypothetical protein
MQDRPAMCKRRYVVQIRVLHPDNVSLTACVQIVDIPLLFEGGLDRFTSKRVTVTSSGDTQLRRLMARDGSSLADAKARIASQMPLAEKVAKSEVSVVELSLSNRDLHRAFFHVGFQNCLHIIIMRNVGDSRLLYYHCAVILDYWWTQIVIDNDGNPEMLIERVEKVGSALREHQNMRGILSSPLAVVVAGFWIYTVAARHYMKSVYGSGNLSRN